MPQIGYATNSKHELLYVERADGQWVELQYDNGVPVHYQRDTLTNPASKLIWKPHHFFERLIVGRKPQTVNELAMGRAPIAGYTYNKAGELQMLVATKESGFENSPFFIWELPVDNLIGWDHEVRAIPPIDHIAVTVETVDAISSTISSVDLVSLEGIIS